MHKGKAHSKYGMKPKYGLKSKSKSKKGKYGLVDTVAKTTKTVIAAPGKLAKSPVLGNKVKKLIGTKYGMADMFAPTPGKSTGMKKVEKFVNKQVKAVKKILK